MTRLWDFIIYFSFPFFLKSIKNILKCHVVGLQNIALLLSLYILYSKSLFKFASFCMQPTEYLEHNMLSDLKGEY